MRIFGTLILSACCQIVLTPSVIADSTDVFPLDVNLRQVYAYNGLYYDWFFSQDRSITDSGFVEYTIVDSATVNDSTVAWSVVEKHSLVRRIVSTIPPVMDTLYSVSDSSSLTLYESLTGNHELQSSSLVWEFPVAFENGQSFPVFRYASDPQTMLAYGVSGCMRFANANYDSLWFSSDSGCYKRYYSRCFDQDEFGWASWRNARLASRTIVTVRCDEPLPSTVRLLPGYPNPFNPTTTIAYNLPEASEVVLAVYDLLGRQVAVLAQGVQQAGRHEEVFNASQLGSNVYFVRLQTHGKVHSQKVLLLK